MSLNEKILDDLKNAMKAKDSVRVSCLRMLKTAVKNRQVEKGRELEDEEILAIVSSLVRKGKEAIGEFRKGDREDHARSQRRTRHARRHGRRLPRHGRQYGDGG